MACVCCFAAAAAASDAACLCLTDAFDGTIDLIYILRPVRRLRICVDCVGEVSDCISMIAVNPAGKKVLALDRRAHTHTKKPKKMFGFSSVITIYYILDLLPLSSFWPAVAAAAALQQKV